MKHFILSFCLLGMLTTYGQPGSPDQSFGQNGSVHTDVVKTKFYSDGNASALQPDGKILVGGNYNSVEIIRYLPDGTPDKSFGNNGVAVLEPVSGSVEGICVQPDGDIIIAGLLSGEILTESVFAARFFPDGTPDPSFGTEGVAKLDFGDYAGVSAVALQPDGKVLLCGGASSQGGSIQFQYSTLVRLTEKGLVDKSFGTDGRVKNKAFNNNTCLAIQEDGKIVTAGQRITGANNFPDYAVSRYNPDGTPDAMFGNKGTTLTDGFGYDDNATSIFLQPDGKIVTGGYSYSGTEGRYVMTAMRYLEDGRQDNEFGMAGKAAIPFDKKASKAYQILGQPDGKMILAGGTYQDNQFNNADYALCRLSENGSVDSSFALDGRQITQSDNTTEEALSALLQPDGKIVLTGFSQDIQDENSASVLLTRYNGDNEKKPLLARIKRFLHNHGIGWQGLNSDVHYYSIQYSKTGSGFTEKGKVSGAGSSSFKAYEYDVSDAGCYRVVAVDGKGYKTFSNKIWVSEADVASAVSVYPNPAKSYVTIQGLPSGQAADITIKDGSGNVLARGVSTGSEQYRSQLGSNMQPGTYYLNITTGNKTEVLKFVKE